MNFQTLAFFTGLIGSLHCVSMCGPLVMALPLRENTWWFNLIQRLLYQLGRILTYSAFGFIAGVIGNGFDVLGLQQLLSLLTGTLLICLAFYHFSGKKLSRFNNLQTKIVAPIARLMGRWFSTPYGCMFAGTLHGLLPCGMVYMALAASLNAGSPFSGSEFMFFFGLGTTPLLLIASAVPIFIRKFKMRTFVIPALFFISGLFLISRGLNLSIPYVTSPVISDSTSACE